MAAFHGDMDDWDIVKEIAVVPGYRERFLLGGMVFSDASLKCDTSPD